MRHRWRARPDQRQSHCGSLPAYGDASQTNQSCEWLSLLRALPEIHCSSSLVAQSPDAFPVRASLMRLGTPRRNDSPLACIEVRVNDRNLHSVHHPNGIHPLFTIIEAVINPLERWTFENPRSIFKLNPMHLQIPAILSFVPSVAHGLYLHNVHTNLLRLDRTHYDKPPISR